MHSNGYTICFVSFAAIVSALLLSSTATSLRARQEANLALDVKRNILKAIGTQLEDNSGEAVESFFEHNIRGVVVDLEGNVYPDLKVDNIDAEVETKKPDPGARRYPIYQCMEGDTVVAYTIPIVGKGLWSTLYGYLSLAADLNTVLGITFYKHGETPGLGAEISEDWFQQNFKGKQICDRSGNLRSIKVVKGEAATACANPDDLPHCVDGISGATITSKGVTAMIASYLSIYEPYFKRVKKEG